MKWLKWVRRWLARMRREPRVMRLGGGWELVPVVGRDGRAVRGCAYLASPRGDRAWIVMPRLAANDRWRWRERN